jgi:C-terminal processing protease CtpA/Prc
MTHPKQWIFFFAALALAGSPAFSQDDCSVVGQNTFVKQVLDEYYLWYQELPDASPSLYESPEAYLDAVRFRPLDTSFSYIASAQATTAFYSSSQFIGIGFGSRILSPEEYRIAQVFPNSPASDAGLARGDYLLAVDGRPVRSS